ncbi:Fc.00g089700.m01.CDS01 [Cosmosporella sp. VM-42]
MYRDIGHALWKRAVEVAAEDGQEPPQVKLPDWTWIVVLLNLLIFLPVFIVLDYSFKRVYPTLAIIEDENPPAYEPVPLDEEVTGVPKPTGPESVGAAAPSSQAVTSSVRRIHRVLKANGGFRGYARGLACFFAWHLMASVPTSIFMVSLGDFGGLLGSICAYLALVQFGTAWVHIVISKPSQLHFWSRLPPFRRTLDATWRPILLNTCATWLATWVPSVLARILDLRAPEWKAGEPTEIPQNHGAAWKTTVIILTYVLIAVFVTVPAQVVLVRVQASLLPEEDETIIPFDRSFQGKVEPAVVGGKGYVSVRDAWATFSTAAWRRLIILYVKTWFISTAVFFVLIGAVFVPQFVLIASKSKVSGDN